MKREYSENQELKKKKVANSVDNNLTSEEISRLAIEAGTKKSKDQLVSYLRSNNSFYTNPKLFFAAVREIDNNLKGDYLHEVAPRHLNNGETFKTNYFSVLLKSSRRLDQRFFFRYLYENIESLRYFEHIKNFVLDTFDQMINEFIQINLSATITKYCLDSFNYLSKILSIVYPEARKEIIENCKERISSQLNEGDQIKDLSLEFLIVILTSEEQSEYFKALNEISLSNLNAIRKAWGEKIKSLILSRRSYLQEEHTALASVALDYLIKTLGSEGNLSIVNEILQNSDDANAKDVVFDITDEYFRYENDGRLFDFSDFMSITTIDLSLKGEDQTGKFGIGFKSIFNLSSNVLLQSNYYNFSFDNSILPNPKYDKTSYPDIFTDTIFNDKTIAYCPFADKLKRDPEILKVFLRRLEEINPIVLLFLKSIERVRVESKHEFQRFSYELRSKDLGDFSYKEENRKNYTLREKSLYKDGLETHRLLIWSKSFDKRDLHGVINLLEERDDTHINLVLKVRRENSLYTLDLVSKNESPFYQCFPLNNKGYLPFYLDSYFNISTDREKFELDGWSKYFFEKLLPEVVVDLVDYLVHLKLFGSKVYTIFPFDDYSNDVDYLKRYRENFSRLMRDRKFIIDMNWSPREPTQIIIPEEVLLRELMNEKDLNRYFDEDRYYILNEIESDIEKKLRLMFDLNVLTFKELTTYIERYNMSLFLEKENEWYIKLNRYINDRKQGERLQILEAYGQSLTGEVIKNKDSQWMEILCNFIIELKPDEQKLLIPGLSTSLKAEYVNNQSNSWYTILYDLINNLDQHDQIIESYSQCLCDNSFDLINKNEEWFVDLYKFLIKSKIEKIYDSLAAGLRSSSKLDNSPVQWLASFFDFLEKSKENFKGDKINPLVHLLSEYIEESKIKIIESWILNENLDGFFRVIEQNSLLQDSLGLNFKERDALRKIKGNKKIFDKLIKHVEDLLLVTGNYFLFQLYKEFLLDKEIFKESNEWFNNFHEILEKLLESNERNEYKNEILDFYVGYLKKDVSGPRILPTRDSFWFERFYEYLQKFRDKIPPTPEPNSLERAYIEYSREDVRFLSEINEKFFNNLQKENCSPIFIGIIKQIISSQIIKQSDRNWYVNFFQNAEKVNDSDFHTLIRENICIVLDIQKNMDLIFRYSKKHSQDLDLLSECFTEQIQHYCLEENGELFRALKSTVSSDERFLRPYLERIDYSMRKELSIEVLQNLASILSLEYSEGCTQETISLHKKILLAFIEKVNPLKITRHLKRSSIWLNSLDNLISMHYDSTLMFLYLNEILSLSHDYEINNWLKKWLKLIKLINISSIEGKLMLSTLTKYYASKHVSKIDSLTEFFLDEKGFVLPESKHSEDLQHLFNMTISSLDSDKSFKPVINNLLHHMEYSSLLYYLLYNQGTVFFVSVNEIIDELRAKYDIGNKAIISISDMDRRIINSITEFYFMHMSEKAFSKILERCFVDFEILQKTFAFQDLEWYKKILPELLNPKSENRNINKKTFDSLINKINKSEVGVFTLNEGIIELYKNLTQCSRVLGKKKFLHSQNFSKDIEKAKIFPVIIRIDDDTDNTEILSSREIKKEKKDFYIPSDNVEDDDLAIDGNLYSILMQTDPGTTYLTSLEDYWNSFLFEAGFKKKTMKMSVRIAETAGKISGWLVRNINPSVKTFWKAFKKDESKISKD